MRLPSATKHGVAIVVAARQRNWYDGTDFLGGETVPTLQVDEAIVPLIMRDIEIKKRVISTKIGEYREELGSFEQRHDLPSNEFLQKFQRGELGDELDWIRWEFLCGKVERLQNRLDALQRVVYAPD